MKFLIELFSDDPIVHVAFWLPIIILLLILFLFIKHALKKKEIVDKNHHLTDFYDDFYPSQRKIKYDATPVPESGVHRKLNYQYVIERMTRKLMYILVLIILFTLSFVYIIYLTSTKEQIAPDSKVMTQYEVMLNKIMTVEDVLEKTQLEPIKELSKECFINEQTTNSLISSVIQETVKNEDKLILDVSNDFFRIYFIRYILVRVLIALAILSLVGYFTRLYFRIQRERLDLIRKEEALSTLFYILESKDGRKDMFDNIIPETGKYKDLTIPQLPLHKLFEPSYTNTSKNQSNENFDNLLGRVNTLFNTQKEFYESLLIKMQIKNR